MLLRNLPRLPFWQHSSGELLSVILSPCHIACIPLIVGFIDGQGNITTRRAFGLSLLFGLGILITIGIIGLITGLLGRMMGDIGGYGNYFVAVIFFAVGLNLLGILPLPFMEGGANPNYKRKGLLAAFILGLLFGIALGPCTFAYMATMLGVVFSMASTKIIFALSLLLAYGIGHCAVLFSPARSRKLCSTTSTGLKSRKAR